MKIPLLDLTRYASTVAEEWLQMTRGIVLSGKILNGPHKKAFEEEFAGFLGVKHVLGVASGTDALLLAMRALDIGKGDEVIIHANAFIAGLEAILAVGGTPVLVDMSESCFGPDVEAVERAITEHTRAIMGVHLCGLPVDIDPLLEIAERHRIALIEDASQAQGGEYRGRRVGSVGMINVFSLGPVKNLGAVGDAGCIATDDDELHERATRLAVHGQARKYEHTVYGWNSRLDEVQAAWLRLGLKTLDARNARRREIYEFYRKEFANLPVWCMPDPPDRTCVFHQGIIGSPRRGDLREYLSGKGIWTGMYYPDALHEQRAWKESGLRGGAFPRAERYARENLALPVFAELTDEEVEYIATSVRAFFRR